MADTRLSSCFNKNLLLHKIFGLWPGRKPSKYYRFFSIPYLVLTLIIYNILIVLNLIYTPRTVESLISEVIFFFTEMSVVSKVSMIFFKQKEIIEAFELLDSEFFKGDDETSTKIIQNGVETYSTGFKFFVAFCHFDFIFLDIVPIFLIVAGAEKILPICRYYFLSDNIRNEYFACWYIYQSIGIYGHMAYNISNDLLIAGMIWMAITQLRVIKYKLSRLKSEKSQMPSVQEEIMYRKLVHCLKHYDEFLKYFAKVQEIITFAIFMQFMLAALLICVVLCGIILLPSSLNSTLHMIFFQSAMIIESFMHAWLGTQLSHEHQELVFAAYSSDWVSRSEKFKKSLRLFVLRAGLPIELTGLKMFPLTIGSFLNIMKFAYSSFTLVRRVQGRQNQI